MQGFVSILRMVCLVYRKTQHPPACFREGILLPVGLEEIRDTEGVPNESFAAGKRALGSICAFCGSKVLTSAGHFLPIDEPRPPPG